MYIGRDVSEINREIQPWRVTRRALSSHSTGSGSARAAEFEIGLGERVLAEAVFPDSAGVKAMQGLVV